MAKKRIDPKLPIPEQGVDRAAIADTYDDRLLRRLNELFREQDDGTIAIFDEETYIGQATGLNFTGAGVTATQAANLPVGNYDITIPGGGGTAVAGVAPTITAEAHEAITKGQFVAVYDDGGLTKCRVAKSSSGQGYQADGWADANFSASATVTIYLPGTVNESGGTGLDAGDVWLGTDGYATSTPPTTAGYISQQIGVAEDGTSVAFEPHPDILIEDTHDVSTGGTSISQTFTSTTTFTVPASVSGMLLTEVGGGGGGRATSSGSDDGAPGGGAGEFCVDFPIPVVPGETLTITIGAGGAGGTTSGTAGSDGGTTSVAGTKGTWSVVGGSGGPTTNAGGAGGGPRGGAGGATSGTGGAGTLGTAESPVHFGGSSGGGGAQAASNNGGAGGGAPGYMVGGAGGVGNANGGGGGGGGASMWGIGGAGGAGGAAGSDAPSTSYGAGGGGGGGLSGSVLAGGDGADGYVMLTYVA